MQPQQEATLTQPFQCDLQPQLQETHRTTHTGATILAKYIEGTKRPQPQPPHTRGTFHRRLQSLDTEKHKVSCSGFLPKTKPMQHSCSHSNAICNHSFKKRTELRTQEQPFVAEHRGGTNRVRNDRRLQPLYAEKHKVSCSGFLPKTLPMQHSCSHSNAICSHSLKKRIELRTQEQPLVAKHKGGTKTTPAAPAVPHHFPWSPPPFLTTPLHHHLPSSPLPFLTTSHRHHLPSSPPPFVTTLCHTFLFYVMYHPSSRSILL